MAQQIRILGIAGSLRRDSYNKAALRAAQQLAPDGAVIEIYDIDGFPGFNQDEDQAPGHDRKIAGGRRRLTGGRADCIPGVL